MNYCPQCATELQERLVDDSIKPACPDHGCGFVFWNNPTPVVAMIVERPDGVVLAHNAQWEHRFFSIITGFLEAGEDPRDCAIRETAEELGLTAQSAQLIGVYSFARQNQVIIAYHIEADGDITLNEELDEYKIVPVSELRGWDMGTGLAINDWLATRQEQ